MAAQSCLQRSTFATTAAASTTVNPYSHTMLLPHTEFPQHVKQIHLREEGLQHLCRDTVYEWQRNPSTVLPGSSPASTAADPFLLHDGPPFANGSLHTGHFLNKCLKDFINRFQMMRGRRVRFVPGWDCHGLPIEVKALEKLKAESEKSGAGVQAANAGDAASSLTPIEVRRLARDFALAAIDEQRTAFKRWGIMGEWDTPYITMNPSYESAQLGVFSQMVQRGLIFRGLKPVFWSPVSRTALAEAELEYVDDHVSPSLYVAFPIPSSSLAPPAVAAGLSSYPSLRALIWTTTPWTLPGNLAISYNEALEYCVVKVGGKKGDPSLPSSAEAKSSKQPQPSKDEEGASVEGSHFLIGADRVQAVIDGVLGRNATIVATVKGGVLAGSSAQHPFADRPSPFLAGSHVTIESGTALVHTAPAHGMEDFQVCRQHGLNEVLCPVDEKGDLTSEAGPELAGQNVLKGANKHVAALLKKKGHLVHLGKLVHRFPYDWRSKTPVIQRATRQWFCALETIQGEALAALAQVELVPAAGRQRLQSMLETRKEWCISRQRHWGVPIPVFYDETGEALLTKESVEHVRLMVEKHGTDCWWTLPMNELLAPAYRSDGHTYTRGPDTMDVWFDSGCSWSSVLHTQLGLSDRQADIYLEGSDQHRGWFQSSLLTCVSASSRAPYRTILTHGMVLDENFRKMSKSLGNVVDPMMLIQGAPAASTTADPGTQTAANDKKVQKSRKPTAKPIGEGLGVDHLRLWVASTDYTGDVSIGKTVLSKVGDALKKLRLSSKFILGCLDDLKPEQVVPYEQLSAIDQYMLHLLSTYSSTITPAYSSYSFQTLYSTLQSFNSLHLSAFYLEQAKDRLYAEHREAKERRQAQTVLLYTLIVLIKSVAPILPHFAEDVYQHVPLALRPLFLVEVTGTSLSSSTLPAPPASIFMCGWLSYPATWTQPVLCARFSTARRVRSHVHKLLEALRQAPGKAFGSFSEATVVVEMEEGSGIEEEMRALGEKEVNRVFNTASTTFVSRPKGVATSAPAATVSTVLEVRECDSADVESTIVLRYQPAAGVKCPRCWKTTTEVKEDQPCCDRCTKVLQQM